jgi:2-keto-3-deoxy-6-phosphogluconate aldolase
VGMGSQLISKKLMLEKDYKTITELTKNALKIINFLKK